MRFLPGSFVVVAGALLVCLSTQAAETFRDCPDCPLMVTVPAGTFVMGSSPSDISNAVSEGANAENIQEETPQHKVTMRPFAISVTEVTRDQFDAFVRDSGYKTGGPCWIHKREDERFALSKFYDWRDPGFSQGGNHPVVCVNWNDAKAYVQWLSQRTGRNYRLPSEAEWEYAARAGTSTPRYWGQDNSAACRNANVSDEVARKAFRWTSSKAFQCTDGYAYTAPVAQFQANTLGLNDMLGNVWEFTEDCYNVTYAGAQPDGSARVSGDCTRHVTRGGSWDSYPWHVRAAASFWFPAADRGSWLGIRVARTD